MVQYDTSVPGNSEIRMKTKILPYPQNQLEFIKQSGEKLDDLHKIKNDKRVTNLQGVRVYTFTSKKLKGDIFLIHLI